MYNSAWGTLGNYLEPLFLLLLNGAVIGCHVMSPANSTPGNNAWATREDSPMGTVSDGGRSGSQPLAPARFPGDGMEFLTPSVPLCPSAHEQSNQPTTHGRTSVPTCVRVPQGGGARRGLEAAPRPAKDRARLWRRAAAAGATCTAEPQPILLELAAALDPAACRL